MESTSIADESQAAAESDHAKNESEDEGLLSRAQELMAKITASEANPSPKVLHALASMLETQESRYLQESGHSSSNNGRTSHNIGRLGNLIRENDEFFELISSKFLTEGRYSVFVRAAAARLLLSCSATWMYPHIFEDAVVENIKRWVMDDPVKASGGVCNMKLEFGRNNSTNSDSEMLRTYATGLLAVSLTGGSQVVEDVLTSGLSAKLMRYLRTQVLGEINASQKDDNYLSESKHTSSATCVRNREESRGRLRQVLDATHLEGTRIGDERFLDNDQIEKDHERSISTRPMGGEEECWGEGVESPNSQELEDALPEVVGVYEADGDVVEQIGEERWHSRDGKGKYGRPTRDEAADENARDDSSRRRANRGWMRNRGTGRINEGDVENERTLTSPGGRSIRDKNLLKNIDIKRMLDEKKYLKGIGTDGNILETEDNDDCFKECRVGTKDISELVNKATKAAKAEARAANAPAEAIKAAGDAAAELVKTAALEALKSTNDEEAAVLAASKAASTVVDAAVATEVSSSASKENVDSVSSRLIEPEADEEFEEFFVLDDESLSQLREKYCIQCLETLGEYVEVLGPVLHEKGIDVCLVLLQRSFKHKDAPEIFLLLPDVLKLICTLSAHRKFAALFVDRGGMQKLLAVERVSQTFFGLSSCLFTIGSLQGIMERVCALPSDVVHQVVELALQLLECTQDQARKNAAIFFAAAFVFRAVLDSFDAQEGLQKMLKLLQGAASVRSGVNSGALSLSNMGTLRNDRSPAEVLTSSEKQIAYHTCVALRQYFRAHLLLLVDSLRPNKISRARNIPSARAAYKPLDISNEAMDAVFLQIQRDRKLGPAFVRTRWAVVDKFLGSNGHTTMLELCQAPPGERYLHDLAQYALGVLHIVTLVPYSRKLIVSATLSNERVGMAVILDAANGSGYVDPEVIQPALNLLVNLVCPPPSISNKPPLPAQGQQSVSVQTSNGLAVENNGSGRHAERNISDRRISLGPGSGCAGLAAQLEQGYRQAREAVRANNGIKVLLHLLHPRIFTPPAALDCLRTLACQVLLGLARDDTIAHILTKLQVGKKLSELIRDSGSQASGTEQGRWQTELAQVAIELIAIVTNSGRASTLAATDAAAPTLRRIERAAIAAATPITYHSKELLLLIHEHLQASGLTSTAGALLKEAQLAPLPSLSVPLPLHQISVQETSSTQRLQWPSGRAPRGFLADTAKVTPKDEGPSLKSDSTVFGSKKKPLVFSSNLSFQVKTQTPSLVNKISSASKSPSAPLVPPEASTPSVLRPSLDIDPQYKTPILLPMKRKLTESKDSSFSSPAKRLNTTDLGFQSPFCQTPNSSRKSSLLTVDAIGFSSTPRFTYGRSTPSSILTDNTDDIQYHGPPGGQMTPQQLGVVGDPQSGNIERVTLDSLVVQYLKHQHRQCPTPITTLPPLSLLHPHVCPEPSHELDAPMNVTARLSTREFRNRYGGIHGHRRNRHFVYSRFRPWRTCRDESIILTSLAFLGDSSRIVTGTHSGELKVFETSSGNVLESHVCHQSPVTLVQSSPAAGTPLILSSSAYDVKLCDPLLVSGEPVYTFDGCKAARFSHSGSLFAALPSESVRREVLLYDIQTHALDQKLSDNSSIPVGPVRGHGHPLVHFSPSDTMLLWNGILWDRRGSGPVHRFDQFTDYGGGGFQPAGNEVIINSEVWDLRKFKLLRSVPSLDQTVITYNASGDVIYAILRRNLEDITSAVYTRRVRHPLYAAFRTIDAVNYSDISTVNVDRGVLAFATEPTDSFVGVVSLDNQEDMFSSARLYEIGRRRPTDDDSDPDDGAQTDDEDDDDESECDGDHPILDPTDLESDDDSDGNGDDDEIDDEDEDDGEFNIDDIEFGGGAGILDMVSEGDDGDDGDDDDSEVLESFSSEDEGGFGGHRFGF